MILKKEIEKHAEEKGVPKTTIDKDWVLGHFIDAIFSIPECREKLMQGMSQRQIDKCRERIRYKVAHLNELFLGKKKLDAEKVLSIGKAQSYGKGFFFNLHHLTQHYKQGKLVHNPYHMLEEGKDEKMRFPEHSLTSLAKGILQLGYELGEESEIDFRRKKKRGQEIER